MNENHELADMSANIQATVENVCERYETAWRRGEEPNLSDALDEVDGPTRVLLLRELIEIEQHYRSRRIGRVVSIAELLEKHPAIFGELSSEVRVDHTEHGARENEIRCAIAASGSQNTDDDASYGRFDQSPAGEGPLRFGHGIPDPQSRGLHVRCPHCRIRIELVDGQSLQSVACSSCGGSFILTSAEDMQSYQPSKDERIAQFTIIEKVGMGAFGTVYRAFDNSLSRTVAIKVPRKGQLTADELEKFIREARTAAPLRHSGIVSVHEVGREDDLIYIVSDFVDGVTLTDSLSGAGPTPREAAELMMKIAGALHYAHEQGVIHRDLKPGNIMLDRRNEPHLMDFGLAKREVSEITMTLDGQVLGTPAYMSPEQARGEGHHVDRRADIYSLGVILFEMLTGERPFRGSTRMLLHQVLTEEAPSPRKLSGSISRDLETICLKCLEKTRDKRYPTAKAVADDLQCYLDGKPIKARSIGRAERGWRWCRRNPFVAGLSALLLLALLSGTVISTFFAVDARRKAAQLTLALDDADEQRSLANSKAEEALDQERIARKERTLAEEHADRAQRERNEKAHQLYLSHMNIAHQELRDKNLARVRELLSLYRPETSGGSDQRDWEWSYLWRRSHTELKRIKSALPDNHPKPNKEDFHLGLVYSPDGQLLITGSSEGRLCVWSADDSKQLKDIQGHRRRIVRVDICADGRFVATAGSDQLVKLWDTSTWTEVRSFPGCPFDSYGMALNAAGDRIAVGNRNVIVIYDTATGDEIRRLSGHRGVVRDIHFSADGGQLVSAGDDRASRLWDLKTGSQPHRFDLGNSVAISPDSSTIATGGADGRVAFWNARSGELLDMKSAHEGDVKRIVFSDDGLQLITAANGTAVQIWDVESRKVIHTFLGHAEPVTDIAMRPGTDRIATGGWDQYTRIWDTASRQECVREELDGILGLKFRPGENQIALATDREVMLFDLTHWRTVWQHDERQRLAHWTFPVAFDPRGEVLATGRGNGIIRIRDVATGELVQELANANHSDVHALTFLHDGRLVSGHRSGEIVFWTNGRDGYQQESHVTISPREVRSLAVNPDGGILAVGCNDDDLVVRLWDLSENRILRELTGHTGLAFSLVFSPDGSQLICGGRDNSLTRWDVATGRLNRRQFAHSGIIFAVDFALSGQRYASCSEDGKVKLWDAATGLEVLTLRPNLGETSGLSFSPDGRFLAVCGQNGFLMYDSHPLTPEVRAEPWVEKLRAEITVRSLGQRVEQLRAEDRVGEWITALEQLGELPGQTPDYQTLRDLYARTMQWEKALAASRRLPDGSTWQHLMLLYMAGEYHEYRKTRRDLLANYEQYTAPWEYELCLAGALLLPPDPADHEAIRVLAKRNAAGPEDWHRVMVGRAMYRLGEFREWYEGLPDDSKLKQGHHLLRLLTVFQDSPTSKNREALEKEVRRQQRGVSRVITDGVPHRYWQSWVQRIAWNKEARSALDSTAGPSDESTDRSE